MQFQDTLKLGEHTRGAYNITRLVEGVIKESGIHAGTCHLFLHSSTSALILFDTADETTKNTTEDFMADLAPTSVNVEETIRTAKDAIPEHIHGIGSQNELTIPVTNNRPGIGIWQGIFFWEEKETPTERKLTVTIIGEKKHKFFQLIRG